MTASPAPSAAPPHAIPCWVDNNSLYFELRGVHGPHVLSFQRYELSKALAILFTAFETEGHGEVYTLPPSPAALIPDKDGITEAMRRDARDILKKLRII